MSSIFSKIIRGEIPSFKIYEDERFFSFLDINPVAKGHVLVIPKKEIDYIFDMEERDLADFMILSKKIAVAIKKGIPCKRVGIAVIGLEVPHAHIHLVPLNSMEDINFSKTKLKMSSEELSETAGKIRSNL